MRSTATAKTSSRSFTFRKSGVTTPRRAAFSARSPVVVAPSQQRATLSQSPLVAHAAAATSANPIAQADFWYDLSQQEEQYEDFEERVVEIQRVTKVVKGGNNLSFRAVVVIGDLKGRVAVGCGKAKEVVDAVQKAIVSAKKDVITVPINRNFSFPCKVEGRFKAARVVLCPSTPGGFGVVAGGSPRVVLELAGIRNASCKQVGCTSPLNNAKATIEGLRSMKTIQQAASERGVSVERYMMPRNSQ